MRAYTKSGREWHHEPTLRAWQRVISINPPIEYALTDDFLQRLAQNEELCIDIGGRNYGVEESVYIRCADILQWIEVAQGKEATLRQQ